MFENFHLAAIVKDRADEMRLLQIPLSGKLQDGLAESWQEQHDEFVCEKDEIEFNAGYHPEEHERFCLPNYELPNWLSNEDSQSIRTLEDISDDKLLGDSVKGIVAFARSTLNKELMLFQNFTRSHVIRPDNSLIPWEGNTYVSPKHPGLTLSRKLSAVYDPDEGKLLFQSFRTVNTFLPLSDFYKEASDQDIREVLRHRLIAPENIESLVTGANQWSRKRFAMLRDSGVLDNVSAQEIQSRSNGYDVDIDISQDRIVFPADQPKAKKLLQFLNEERFRGAITDTVYETNSKKQADR